MARILLVEDDPLVRNGFAKLLAAAGFSVVAATTGEGGVSAVTTGAPDLIILDVGLPDIDGFECARRLRDLKVQAPIIFLTAYGGADFVARAIERQAYGYLVKPITGAQLVPIVQTALSAAMAEQEKEDKLMAALNDSRQISAAVGMLAERNDWSIEKAFQALRMMARSESKKIVDVAAEVIGRSRTR